MTLVIRVILIDLFIVLSTLLGASLVSGQVGGGDHNTMNVGNGGSSLALPAPLHLAPVAAPQPMQMTQPIQTLPMAPMHEVCPQMHETFASQHMHHAYNYNPMLLQDFTAHQQMPMSPISLDETRV